MGDATTRTCKEMAVLLGYVDLPDDYEGPLSREQIADRFRRSLVEDLERRGLHADVRLVGDAEVEIRFPEHEADHVVAVATRWAWVWLLRLIPEGASRSNDEDLIFWDFPLWRPTAWELDEDKSIKQERRRGDRILQKEVDKWGLTREGPKFWMAERDGIAIHVSMISRVARRIWLPDALIWTVDVNTYVLSDELATRDRQYSLVSLEGRVWWHDWPRDPIPEQYGINGAAFLSDAREMTFEVALHAVGEAPPQLEDLISAIVADVKDTEDPTGEGETG